MCFRFIIPFFFILPMPNALWKCQMFSALGTCLPCLSAVLALLSIRLITLCSGEGPENLCSVALNLYIVHTVLASGADWHYTLFKSRLETLWLEKCPYSNDELLAGCSQLNNTTVWEEGSCQIYFKFTWYFKAFKHITLSFMYHCYLQNKVFWIWN